MTSNKILPKSHYPISIEGAYKSFLLSFNSIIKKRINDQLLHLLTNNGIPYLYNLDIDDNLDDILENISTNVKSDTDSFITKMKVLGFKAVTFILRRLRGDLPAEESAKIRIAERFSVNIFSTQDQALDRLMEAWIDTNTRLITSIPVQFLDNVALIVNEGFRNGYSVTKIKSLLKKQYKIADNRARLIARDQIAKLSSTIIRHESLALGADTYVWVTANADNVRVSHKAMEGKICSWEDPTIYKNKISDPRWLKRSSIGGVELHVGQDFQCRCSPKIILPQL